MKSLKSLFARLLCIIVGCLLTVSLAACGGDDKPSDLPSSGNISVTSGTGSGGASGSTSGTDSGTTSGSTSGTSSGTSSGTQKTLNAATVAAYPTVYDIYLRGKLDGTYTGTNVIKGFSQIKARTSGTFEAYPEGYGAGTTGGRGATSENVYSCATGNQVRSAISAIKQKQATDAALKSIILITAEINESNTASELEADSPIYQIVVDSVDNLSVIGANSNAIFNGVGLNFKSSDNVIVQNIKIHHPSRPSQNSAGKTVTHEKDCLEFNKCNYVWVDHNEFYNDYPYNDSEKDYFDGLCDVKNESSHVTISYNYLHDAWKTTLIGSGDGDVVDNRTVTYHHNIFEDCSARLPLIRGGYTHLYNNYYVNITSTAINTRIGAQVYVESNVFENVKNPICSRYDVAPGYYNQSGNVYSPTCSGSLPSEINTAAGEFTWSIDMQNTTDFTPSYSYTLDGTADLITFLNATVGTGKINVATAQAEDTESVKYVIAENLIFDRTVNEIGTVSLNNASLQKLIYSAKELLTADNDLIAGLTKINLLVAKIDDYNKLDAQRIDNSISAIDTSGAFDVNAAAAYGIKTELEITSQYVLQYVTKRDVLNSSLSHYDATIAADFNADVNSLGEITTASKARIDNLLSIYENLSSSHRTAITTKSALDAAKTLCENKIAAAAVELMITKLPAASAITIADDGDITLASLAFDNLSNEQKALISQTNLDKYTAVIERLTYLKSGVKSMNLTDLDISTINGTDVTGGKRINKGTFVTAGDVILSGGIEVLQLESGQYYKGTTYNRTIKIPGYGNPASGAGNPSDCNGKYIKVSVYSTSSITLVLKSNPKAEATTDVQMTTNILLGKLNNNNGTYTKEIIGNKLISSITSITFENVPVGEYYIYTDMPTKETTTFGCAEAFVYALSISPTAE